MRVHRRGHGRVIQLAELPIYDRDIIENGFRRGRPGMIVQTDADCAAFYRQYPAELAGTYAARVALAAEQSS